MTPQPDSDQSKLSFGHVLPPEESPAPGKGTIRVLQLYPRDMNIYGDWGNALVLAQRLRWHGYTPELLEYNVGDEFPADIDLIVGGGGQDSGQLVIQDDLLSRESVLKDLAEDGTPMLVICGLYQLFGKFFKTRTGSVIPGIGILDVETHGTDERLIGNVSVSTTEFGTVLGYENHSGQTTLGPGVSAVGDHRQGHRQQQQRRPGRRPLPEHRGELPARIPAAEEPGAGGLPHPDRRRTQIRQLLPRHPGRLLRRPRPRTRRPPPALSRRSQASSAPALRAGARSANAVRTAQTTATIADDDRRPVPRRADSAGTTVSDPRSGHPATPQRWHPGRSSSHSG